jgi:transcriptional regulator with XRE-family HTH domain
MPFGKTDSDCADLGAVQESMPIGIDSMTEAERIKKRIRALMEQRGIKTDMELSRLSGVSQSVLSRILSDKPDRERSGKRPSHQTISKLERFFGEPIDHSPRPVAPGLEDFIRRKGLGGDEADAMRRVGVPPGRRPTDDYWTLMLAAIRAAPREDG